MPYVTCPDCDHESMAPRELIGLEWTCPKCSAPFVVEDDEPRAPLRRRKRNNSGPWVAMAVLLAAGVFVFGLLAYAVSRASRGTEEKPLVAAKDETKRPSLTKEDRAASERVRTDEREERSSGGIGDVVLGVALLLFGVPCYFAPTLVALARGHNNVTPIFVVNFFLGWLLIGWVVAMSWAFTDLKHLEHRRRSYL